MPHFVKSLADITKHNSHFFFYHLQPHRMYGKKKTNWLTLESKIGLVISNQMIFMAEVVHV